MHETLLLRHWSALTGSHDRAWTVRKLRIVFLVCLTNTAKTTAPPHEPRSQLKKTVKRGSCWTH
ncbi:TPA: hypothetical protein N0F65_011453 [Lagenidium giganteum]|uniref:Secreted protein n=1 Tax=Lagenidium giganteum TaxID=4803 RepID=A0AAV2ZE24_9STRA|nr:TPA: hypothetical protein N0F65_011453 [Lagenidium giganteum]